MCLQKEKHFWNVKINGYVIDRYKFPVWLSKLTKKKLNLTTNELQSQTVTISTIS